MTRFAKALFIVSLVILGFSHALAKSKTDICIMTYNIRLSADDGVNKWTNRSADNIKMLEYYSPDLIGMQEVRPDQLADLNANLSSYGHVGAGRDDGKNEGEHCPIFYKKNRFVLIKSGNFALSENPNVYGVKGWDASYPRIATWAILKDRKTGKKIAYFNHINAMNLRNPRMIGFGISNKQTLESAQANAAGAIIGSKFVTLLNETKDPDKALDQLQEALKK